MSGWSEWIYKLQPPTQNIFLYGERQKIKRTSIHLQIKAVLKAHNKDKQKFQEFPETALGGWEAAGFARCSLSTEK